MLSITTRRLQILKAINRHGVLPSNFIYALDPGHPDRSKRNLQALRDAGYLYLPKQQEDAANFLWAFNIYALTDKGKDLLLDYGIERVSWTERQFWHQLMIAQIVCSFQLIARQNQLAFKTHPEFLRHSLSLPCSIEDQGNTWSQALYPDALFQLGEKYFVVEADRDQEPIWRATFTTSSWRRKLLQYREVLKAGVYKYTWGLPSILILNITTGVAHARNIIDFMDSDLNAKSQALLFKAIPILGTKQKSAQPLYSLWDDPFERVGYPPITIKEIVHGEHAGANTRTA